jgi:C1A family cysteine protease
VTDLKPRAFGWRPDLPDQRDYRFAITPGAQRTLPVAAAIPARIMPPIWDQGDLGACTAFMAGFMHETLRRKQGLPKQAPSPLFTYWATRFLEGGLAQTKWDSGATIRDAVRSLAKFGQPTDETWPYDPALFARRPPAKAWAEGEKRQVLTYQRVTSLDGIRAAIVDECPVGFGYMVYESHETQAVARTGRVPMPGLNEAVLGGHACSFVAYDDTKRLLKFRNQWTAQWGDKGYGYLPYEFVTNPELCTDWWIIRTVEAG